MSLRDDIDIVGALAERIEALAAQLLPGGQRDGRLWRCGSLAGEAGQSLAIVLSGPKRGCWFEHNGGLGGSALHLVAQCCCHGDIREAVRWSRDWLGWGQLDAEERARIAARLRDEAARREQAAERERGWLQREAKRLWLDAKPLQRDDLVWRYLQGRGIELSRLPRLPGALRCHPRLFHRKSGASWPAMVAAIAGLDGSHVATQRTWLEVHDDVRVTKAPLSHDSKMSLGSYRHCGGAIHLTRGASGKAWKEAPEGETVAFAEGIEDALTFACARPDLRVAACATSLAYLAHVALPPGAHEVIVIAQNDPKGSDAMKAQRKGIEGLRLRGYRVSVFRPPVFLKDVNDWAQWLARLPVQREAA